MREKYTLNLALIGVVGGFCLAAVLLRAFAPAAVLPAPRLPAVAACSVLALIIEAYLSRRAVPRQWGITALLGALSFGLLPLCAGLMEAGEAVRFGAVGGVCFLVLTFLFTSLRERLSTGPAAPLSPLAAGGVLFLAMQCFDGMLL